MFGVDEVKEKLEIFGFGLLTFCSCVGIFFLTILPLEHIDNGLVAIAFVLGMFILAILWIEIVLRRIGDYILNKTPSS